MNYELVLMTQKIIKMIRIMKKINKLIYYYISKNEQEKNELIVFLNL